MIKHPLFPVVFTALFLLAGMNLSMAVWSHRLPYYKKLEEIRTTPDANLLLIGNSLLDKHVDYPTVEQAAHAQGIDIWPLNAALGASRSQDHLLLFNYALRIHPHLQTVVVGFYDLQLTLNQDLPWNRLFGNAMVGIDPRFSLDEVDSAYSFDRLSRAEFRLGRALPMVAHRHNAWKYVELLRRSMSQIGMPAIITNSLGRAQDFAAMEGASPQIFDEEVQIFLNHPDRFNPSYEKILQHAQRNGMKSVLLLMPISPYHRSIFYSRPMWEQYMKAIKRLASQRGIRVIDGSDWISKDEYFVDHLHMAQSAVPDFSVRLGSELAASPK